MSISKIKTWDVKLSSGDDSSKKITMYDVRGILGNYIKLNRIYFDELLKSINTSRFYNISKGITEIIGVDGKNWTENPWLLILTKSTILEDNAAVWFLIKRENDLNGFLVAIGPNLFYEYISNSKDNTEELHKLLEYIIDPRHWNVSVFIPDFLT